SVVCTSSFDSLFLQADAVMRQSDFFFQAEDGIRDRNVTGVQTCALPISSPSNLHPSLSLSPTVASERPKYRFAVNCASTAAVSRSEERRVGKECASRWVGERVGKENTNWVGTAGWRGGGMRAGERGSCGE